MRYTRYLALLSSLALLFPLSALARDKNEHTVEIADSVQIGSSHLKAGSYKVEWDGMGPAVQVRFLRDGKTVAKAPATLRTNDNMVQQDAIVTDMTSAKTGILREIDFAHPKEALLFTR